jgi:hypothetical protein
LKTIEGLEVDCIAENEGLVAKDARNDEACSTRDHKNNRKIKSDVVGIKVMDWDWSPLSIYSVTGRDNFYLHNSHAPVRLKAEFQAC